MAHESSQLRVHSRDLRNVASELRSYNSQLRNKLQNLDSREIQLGNMWEGDARNAFRQQYRTNRSRFDEFLNLVDQYVRALETAASEYDFHEAQNVSIAKTC